MTITSNATGSTRRRPWLARVFEAIGYALDTISRWQTVRHEREQLASFDDRLLQDIGLTRADVERECRKPFWRT